MPSSATQIAREAGRSSSRSVGSHSLIADVALLARMQLPWPSRAPMLECSLSRRYGKAACTARMAALQMHQPATAELIRKTDEQTDALLRQKKLLQAMACFHPSPALRGAPASAGPGGSDGRACANQSRCTG